MGFFLKIDDKINRYLVDIVRMDIIKKYTLFYGDSCYWTGCIHGALLGYTLTALFVIIVVNKH